MRPIRIPVRIGWPGSRGRRSMRSGSPGSKASIRPRATAVVMLIHRIWTGVIGRVVPTAIAARITRPSPRLVGRVHVMNFVRLSKTPRPSSTAASMVAKLSSVRTMSAESLATSEPTIPIATPMSACLSAGASLTPSPVIATTSSRDCRASTMRSFCSAVTRAKTWVRSIRSGRSSSPVASSSRPVTTTGLHPGPGQPDVGADGRPGGRVVAGDHLDRDPGRTAPRHRRDRLGPRGVDEAGQPHQRESPGLQGGVRVGRGVDRPGARGPARAGPVRRAPRRGPARRRRVQGCRWSRRPARGRCTAAPGARPPPWPAGPRPRDRAHAERGAASPCTAGRSRTAPRRSAATAPRGR